MYMLLCLCACTPVDVYGQSHRCWNAIVMDFNSYWAALPTGGWRRLSARCNCKVWELGEAGSVTEAQTVMMSVGVEEA